MREVKRYSWKTDKDGNLTDDVVKFDDHALDAGRYASFHFNKPKRVRVNQPSSYSQSAY